MAIHLVITVAKRVPVILDERRRYGRIAEARVAAGIGRRSPGNITLCCFDTIMVTLFGSLRICRRRRWGVVRGRLRMRASGKCNGKQQCCHRQQFLHDMSLVCRLKATQLIGRGFLRREPLPGCNGCVRARRKRIEVVTFRTD
jgi:hypothetical protein